MLREGATQKRANKSRIEIPLRASCSRWQEGAEAVGIKRRCCREAGPEKSPPRFPGPGRETGDAGTVSPYRREGTLAASQGHQSNIATPAA
ncbi:hypothetical protein ACOMHN_003359 [Nucella lapillus]